MADPSQCAEIVFNQVKEKTVVAVPGPDGSSSAPAAHAQVDEEEGPPWSDMWPKLVIAERVEGSMDTNGDWKQVDTISIVKRAAMARLTSICLEKCLGGLTTQGTNLDNVFHDYSGGTCGKPLKLVNLFQETASPTKLYLWGRVVDRAVAANLPRG